MSGGREHSVSVISPTPVSAACSPRPLSSEAILRRLTKHPHRHRFCSSIEPRAIRCFLSHEKPVDPLHRLGAVSPTPKVIDAAYLCQQLEKNGTCAHSTYIRNIELLQRHQSWGQAIVNSRFPSGLEPLLSATAGRAANQEHRHLLYKFGEDDRLKKKLSTIFSFSSQDALPPPGLRAYTLKQAMRVAPVHNKIQSYSFLFPPPLRRRRDRLKALALQFFLLGSLFYVPVVLYFVYKKYCTTRRRRVFFLLLLIILYLLPISAYLPSRRWKIWDLLHSYHRTTVILENAKELPPQKPAIYAALPHGIVPVAQGLLSLGGFHTLLGSTRLVVASIVKNIPIWGHCARLFGAYSADKASLRSALQHGKDNLLIVPGGIAEMYETSSTTERLHLKNRKGFIKLALETGADLIPVYCFGNTQTFKLAPGSQVLKPFGRLLQTAFLLFYGRFGLPIGFEVPLLYVVGRRLKMPVSSRPTDCEIHVAHKLFLEEVRRLFDTYKHFYGWENKTLQIV